MKTKIFQGAGTQARLELGPFHEFLDDYVDELRRIGYPDPYLRKCFRVIIRLSDWVGLKHIPLKKFTQLQIDEFWKFHGTLRNHHDFKVLGHFLQFLRNRGVIPNVPQPKITCPIEKILNLFESYLRGEKGLSEIYIYQQVRTTRFFLSETFLSVGRRWDRYTAQIIGDYLTKLLKNTGPSEAKDATVRLAQFFKFLFVKGKIKSDLSFSIPRPATWRHTRLPIYIGPDEVEKLFNSCDRETQIGARDYAILMLLARLGLRACEIRNLTLDDVHWRTGAITVRGKGKESKMPLPEEAGGAIAAYIKTFRPKSSSRALFVSVHPPYHGLLRSASVSGVVGFALKRAKVESKHRGAYLLRHTMANECLKNGANLDEIGQLLRHDQLSTTSIYAKVDFGRLSLVVRPWLGGGR